MELPTRGGGAGGGQPDDNMERHVKYQRAQMDRQDAALEDLTRLKAELTYELKALKDNVKDAKSNTSSAGMIPTDTKMSCTLQVKALSKRKAAAAKEKALSEAAKASNGKTAGK